MIQKITRRNKIVFKHWELKKFITYKSNLGNELKRSIKQVDKSIN